MTEHFAHHIRTTFLSIGIFLLSVIGFSQPVPQQSNPPRLVVDEAQLMSAPEIAQLEKELIAFSDTTSNQIVVVTMNDLEGYQPWEVAYNIGKVWGVGQAKLDNGIVILVKPKTADSKGEVFIAVGKGLEGAIPDATTRMIIEREMIPFFKQGEMQLGIRAGVQTLKELALGEYNSDEYASKGKSESWLPFLFILIVFILAIIGKARAARSYSVGHDLPFWTALMLLNQSRGHGGSFGNFSSGGGGFGGFGGGGFGGGGAGGSW
jgi:uncharacterized protein